MRLWIVLVFIGLVSHSLAGDLEDLAAEALTLFGMFGGNTVAEDIVDSKIVFREESAILTELMKTRPKGIPKTGTGSLTIKVQYTIDHIEALEEDEETITVHGSVTLTWNVPEVGWDPSKHKQIKAISRNVNDYHILYRPWIPQINFKSAEPTDNLRAEGAEAMTSMLSLLSNGDHVYYRKFSVVAPCDFNYRDFPYDIQSCNIIMHTPHTIREVFFESSRNVDENYIRQMSGNHTQPTIGDFVLDGFLIYDALYRDGFRPETIKDRFTGGQDRRAGRMAVFLNLYFKRLDSKYFLAYSLPLVVCAVLAQSSLFLDTRRGFIICGLSFILLTCQISLITEKFPSDADGTSVLAMMHYFCLVHIVFVFICLILLSTLYGGWVGHKKLPNPGSDLLFDETTARYLIFVFSFVIMMITLSGTLVFTSWHHWERAAGKFMTK